MSWLFTRKSEEKQKPDGEHEATASELLSGTEFDPAVLHPLANLGGSLDYLNIEEDTLSNLPGDSHAIPSRGWQDDLCYGTGTMYLGGLAVGGLWGLKEGLKKTENLQVKKLRVNGILNSVTRRGPFVGNSAGILAMMYNSINSFIGYKRGKHDWTNSVAAGAITGAVFKSTRGVRAMGISSAMIAGAAGAWCLLKRAFS
ncbi:TIM23 translocase complex subunit Tim23 [Schizosaccharomyces japonicus yFS275]|uniref:Mitochondrial import inner membrane translocase subunit TIM23 n=1 Tax=Schizosaccharomyces japonicus (strain yFS275 / FY16936) TaxID=402676 RepID=B6K690_SCHJY|nr:TIM23 translocase complex subunit Tim23 [Schizosaccharomyces japonicus yFS275]EEB09044.1 TIM23 translocase complex subunit Tim23 [Schizosaccharomyces japonicus yFS275]